MAFIGTVLDKLSSKPKVGGLLVSDSTLQYVFLDGTKGKAPEKFSVPLPPGVLREGKIKAPDQLALYFRELHRLITGGTAELVKVVVTLPPAVIYTQSFHVPKINEERLEEATGLNLRIITPIEVERAFMSSQVIGGTEDRYDLLGAFVEKDIVLKLKDLLSAAGFEPLIFEFPSLALARTISSSLKLSPSPVFVLQVSSDGLDLSIIRGNSIYFEYFRPWRSVQGEAREITRKEFESVVVQEVKKVIDFSLSRFKENLAQTLVSAPGFEREITELLRKNFGLQAFPLTLKSFPFAPNWYTVLGSAIRGRNYGGADKEINLSGLSLKEVFREERTLSFIGLWRNIIVGAALIMLIVFGGSAAILSRQSNTTIARLESFTAQISESELSELKTKVSEFNGLVVSVRQARELSQPWYQTLSRIKKLADDNSVTVYGFGAASTGEMLSLSGRAPSASQVLKFKNILVDEPDFLNVNLPLASISALEDGSVGFNLGFEMVEAE